ncbi:MAG: T9SS type A sorting domain-containing protein, partial [Bacteroidetes bacterium]|nr:T9SS type A sorting domain-containing protein [Bacteroidota bacterium]
DMEDQGDGVEEWGTFFDYTQQSTTNAYADVAWYNDNVNTGIKNKIYYYYLLNPNVDFKPIFKNNTSIQLDGYTVTSANIDNETLFDKSDVNSCRGTFKMDPNGVKSSNEYLSLINIYPNPTNDKLNVSSPNGELIKIKVMDISGKELWTSDWNKSNILIDCNNFNSGFYLIQVFTNDYFNSKTYKISVNHD